MYDSINSGIDSVKSSLDEYRLQSELQYVIHGAKNDSGTVAFGKKLSGIKSVGIQIVDKWEASVLFSHVVFSCCM